MKRLFSVLFVAMASSLVSGCFNSGSPADPPADFMATAGDGRVELTWTASPGVDYWLFTATDPSLTAFNWTSLPNARVFQSAASPFYVCGLLDGTEYWYAANGRMEGGPGGPSSATVSATPRRSGSAWNANAALPPSPDLFGVGYAGLTTCKNNGTSAAGSFAAVGAGGAIFTSADGANWTNQAAPSGFTSDLYAVAGYAANQNNPTNPALRWVAVGAGGASVYGTNNADGIVWAPGRAFDLTSPALRSLTQVAGTFFAVGDAGTILSSTDGITWTARTSGTSANLNGVTYGGIYVAVGSAGTILTSADGATWAPKPSGTTSILRNVASIGSTYVAVGDGGTVATSTDTGATWAAQTLAGAPNLVGVAANARFATLDSNGLAFTASAIAPNSQFVAVDRNGNAYTSPDGITWSAAIPTGVASVNALVSSGFGYVVAGNAGVTATSF